MQEAAEYAINQVAHRIERQAKINARGPSRYMDSNGKVTPSRHIDWQGHNDDGTQGPNVIHGVLLSSIGVKSTRKGFGVYTAEIAPWGVSYAYSVETGDGLKGGVKYPYLIPAAKKIAPQAMAIFEEAYKRKRTNG